MIETISVSRLLAPAAPAGTHTGICGICAAEGETHYHKLDVLDKLTSNVTAFFTGQSELMCASCAALWRQPKYWHRAILATPDRVLFPVISAESATPERPAWSQAIREVNPAQPRVAVLNTDPKKRVWPHARVSAGDGLWLYVYDSSRCIAGNRLVSLSRLIATLDTIERIYSMGFTKDHIETSLLSYQKLVVQLGATRVARLERELADLRRLPEFAPAVIIAQKQEAYAT